MSDLIKFFIFSVTRVTYLGVSFPAFGGKDILISSSLAFSNE